MPADLCPACGVSLPRDLMPTHLARAHPDRRGPPPREERAPTPPPTEAYEGDVSAPPSPERVPDGQGQMEGGVDEDPEPLAPSLGEASPPPVLDEIPAAPGEGAGAVQLSSVPDPEPMLPPGSWTDPEPGEREERRSEGRPRLEPDVPIPSRKALRTSYQRRRQQTNRSLAQAEALLIGFPSGSSRRVQRRVP